MSTAAGGPNAVEAWLTKVMERLRGQGGFLAVTLGALVAGLSAIPGCWWLAIVGAVIVVVGIVFQLALEPSYADLAKQADEARGQAQSTAMALQSALESILRRIAQHCGIDQTHQRISIYCHVNDEFVLLARESRSTELQASGRPSYPSNQGVIGEAWDKGQSTRWDWPTDREEWNELQVTEYGIAPEVAARLYMQARSIVAMRLTHDHVHVGVIVMESTQARGVRNANLTAARKSLLLESASEILESARPNFPAVAEHLKQTAHIASSAN